MRLNRFFCLALLAVSLTVQAQDLIIMVDKKGKVGFSDQNGNEVIKCQYSSALPFNDGVAIVTKSGKSGMIDASGQVVLPLKYTQITSWNSNLYLAKSGKKMGLVNHRGEVVLPVNYSHISKPNCYGKALIALGGRAMVSGQKTFMANAKYGIIDVAGHVLVTPKYKGLYEFSYDCTNIHPYDEGKRLDDSYHYITDTLKTDCAYLGFSKNGFSAYNSGIMDGNGNELLKVGLYHFVMKPQSGMVRYYNVNKKETICGYHNLQTGKSFIAKTFKSPFDNIKFWSHGDFIGNIAPVNGESWSFIDKNGTTLRTSYQSLKHSENTGLWAAKNSSGTWDVFDDANNNVDLLSGFADINFPINEGDKEIFSVEKDGKWGCVNRSGQVVVPFNYEMVTANKFDVVGVKKNGKWGLVTADNSPLIPAEYADVQLPIERNANHLWVQKADSLYYHMNLETKQLSKSGFKSAYCFFDGLAFVVPQKMEIDNTLLNRAQMYEPNTDKATIDKVDINENAFVNIINVNDELVFSLPVSTMYMVSVRDRIVKMGRRQLTQFEMKNLLLELTKENRSYDLNSTLGEEEWNY